MKKFPQGGLVGKAYHTAREISALQIPMHAAYASYFIILSLFPALLLILSILSYTSLDVNNFLDFLQDFLPSALMSTARKLVYSVYRNSSGAVLGLSAVTALWSASRGIFGLLRGLNAIYDVSEQRGYFYTRLISLIYTFVFFLVLVVTLLLHVFGNTIIGMLAQVNRPVLIFLMNLIDLRFFLLLILQSLAFTAMFMALPNKRNSFWGSLPGGVLSSLGWLVYSDIFSIYVENFNRYSNIYGSVYAVALGMLWLYCCVSILFYGGALNRSLKNMEIL